MRATPALLVAALAVSVSCNKDTTGPTHGWLRVSTASSGFDIDPDGYAFRLDGGQVHTLGVDDAMLFAELVPGAHELRLEGRTPNCVAAGGDVRSVTVVAGDTALAPFVVTCAHRFGAVRVSTTTVGQDPDLDGYHVTVDGIGARALAVTDSTRYDGLLAGRHTVVISGAATNCTILPDTSRQVTIVAGDTARVAFAVTCAPRLAAVTVQTVTQGDDPDPDGYAIQLDNGAPLPARASDTVRFTGLREGVHHVTLSGAAVNCTVSGGGGANVQASFDLPGAVVFVITCAPRNGTLVVSARTTGSDIDRDGFYLLVDSAMASSVSPNGTAAVGLHEGDHQVSLAGVDANCHVVGADTVSVHVTYQHADTLAFAVTCTALAVLHVTVSTTGTDLDSDGYQVIARGATSVTSEYVGAEGTATLTGLGMGDYVLQLTGVAANCAVAGADPRTVGAISGQVVEVAVTVACAAATPILYTSADSSTPRIFVIGSDGRHVHALTNGQQVASDPAWAPGGARIAYVNGTTGTAGIWIMNADGSNPVRLTSDTTVNDRAPAWSPDGSRIAFVRTHGGNADIAVMNADGSNVHYLTSDAGADVDPAWSPDGSRIAFASSRDGDSEIYTMSADGSNVVQLTHNTYEDLQPDWSPDGTRIAFSTGACAYYCSLQPAIINADGSGLRVLAESGIYAGVSWSPDGHHLVFTANYCDYYGYYCYAYLSIARVDGYDDYVFLVGPDATQPAWRR